MPGPPQGRDQRLSSEHRLRRRADYLRAYRTGRRRQGALVILYFVPSPAAHARLGITASRKVGGAVLRHLLKRRTKEIYRRWPERGKLPPVDLVVHLKPEAGTADFAAFRAELVRLLAGVAAKREAAA
jgi:ribonuclease P protein component